MIYSVQYLRGIAALLVVLHHIGIKGAQYNVTLLDGFHIGYFGVDLFFIISAFIMCNTTDKKSITFSRFIGARITRIMPLYWLMSLLALVVFLIKPSLVNSSGGVTSIWASFTLLPNGDRYLVNNGWTLSYEFIFYFIFGVAIFLSEKRKILITSSIIIMLCTLGVMMKFDSSYYTFLTSKMLFEFIMGMGAFIILQKYNLPKSIATVLLTGGILLLFYQNNFGTIKTPLSRTFFAGIPMLMIFIGTVRFEYILKRQKNKFLKLIEELGNSSYSLYLIHAFVLSPCALIAAKLGLTSYPLIFCAIPLIASLAAGWLCYKYIETPINNKLKIHTAKQREKAA
ncbi:acyltransferase family protein [Acerihabitans arboris]|uniref:Acyltransferase family protein n=1 Tax=Acerihabitans arboris TaxID=2691583 RepID=A0A845SH03_9GAMM|nr:acyltransferase [Acerihabitans arboris]NDL62326.1 acyltransferase family protein [Acerihabitans arboris]